jgi:hypothetical protein
MELDSTFDEPAASVANCRFGRLRELVIKQTATTRGSRRFGYGHSGGHFGR